MSFASVPGEEHQPQGNVEQEQRSGLLEGAQVQRDRRHREREAGSNNECMRRGPDELHREQADKDNCPTQRGHEVKAGEHIAERGLGQEKNHSPDPDGERGQRGVPNDEHPVIIIGALQDLRAASMEDGRLFDEVVNRALREPGTGSDVVPAIVRVLMRRYATTGRPDLEEAIGPALARALDASESGVSPAARADLILLFVEGAALSSDERLRQAVSLLVSKAIEDWPAVGDVASAARSIDSCLRGADLISSDDANRLIAIAVDELERIVGPCYRPGEGMAHSIDDHEDTRNLDGLSDHRGCSSNGL